MNAASMHSNSGRRLAGRLAIGLSLLALIAAVSHPINGESAPALGAGRFLMDDWAGGNTHADRAVLPAIFMGRVIGRDGEYDIAEPDAGSFIVPVCSIDVETTLKGDADGRIRLAVVETDYAEERGGSPMEIGKRYLFAAVDDPDGVFTIDEGFGNVIVGCDEEAAELISEFRQLISESESAQR